MSRPSTLQAGLLRVTLPATVLVVAAIALSTYVIARSVVLGQLERDVQRSSEIAATEARAALDQSRSDVATLADSPLFKDHFANLDYGLHQEASVYRREIERMLAAFARRTGVYRSLTYADARGRVLARVEGDKAVAPAGRVEAELARAAASLPPGKVHASDPRTVDGLDYPVAAMAIALRDETGAVRGLLAADYELQRLNALLARLAIGKSGRSALVPRLEAREAEARTALVVGDSVVSRAQIPGTRWAILTTVDRDEFLGPLSWIGGATFLLGLLACVGLGLAIAAQVRASVRPIQALAAASESYASGDLQARVVRDGPREVAVLADAFNAMGERLQTLLQTIVASEARYRTAVENSPHAVVSLDRDMKVTLWNRRAETLFGWPAAEAVGRTLDFVLDAADYREIVRAVESSGAARDLPAVARARDGRRLAVTVSWTGQAAATGEWFVVVQDETEKRRLQAQLLHAEKLSAVGTLMAGVAHELNNPLAAVVGFAEILQGLTATAREREDLKHLYGNALRCRDIVRGLLSFVRRAPPRRVLLDLNELVERSLELVEYRLVRTDGVLLDVEPAPGPLPIAGDPSRVEQVVVNLLSNASDALRAWPRERRVRILTRAEAGGACLVVEDSGPGVPAEYRDRLFEPFFTTKPLGVGTGLGLAISNQIVAELGGRLRYEERPEGGARFVVAFPPPGDAQAEQPAPEAERGRRAGRVLVVDDEAPMLALMERILSDAGNTVRTARGYEDARRRLRSETFDLLVVDADLGPRKGWDLLEVLPDPPPEVVIVTGDVLNPELAERFSSLDMPVLAKPFLRSEFLRAVRHALERAAGAA